MATNTLVTVATFPTSAEAYIVRNYLAVRDVYAVVTEGGASSITGAGVAVDVPEDELARATSLLEQRHHHHGPPAAELPGDRLAAQALNLSTLGYFFIPVLMHLLSAGVLFRLRWSRMPLSQTGERHARDAARINWIILGVAAICAAIVALLIWAPWRVPMTP